MPRAAHSGEDIMHDHEHGELLRSMLSFCAFLYKDFYCFLRLHVVSGGFSSGENIQTSHES